MIIDLVGQKFSRLLVIKFDKIGKHRGAQWKCLCDCGKTTIVGSNSLKMGRIRSCGCLKYELNKTQFCLPKGEASFNRILESYTRNARKRSLEFRLTKGEFRSLITSQCFYCTKPPAQIARTKDSNGEFIYNGIDRKDNNKGYILTNVVSCCKICNRAKSDLNEKEFLLWIKRVYNNKIKPGEIK